MASHDDDLQYHLQLKPGDIGRYVLLPGDRGRVPQIAERFDWCEEVADSREYLTYRGEVEGIPVAVTSTGIGCPSAAICVEELCRVGADTLISVGTAGALQPQIEMGDLVIATAAVRDEGTTRQYVPLEYPAVAHPEMVWSLREAARSLGHRHHVGITHCKDSFYAEEPQGLPLEEHLQQRWTAWERAQVLSTSMEASAIFVLSSLKNLRAGEVVAVIGLTHAGNPVIKKVGIDEAIDTAIEAIKLLHQQDKA
jgi:uridine phosphorylase